MNQFQNKVAWITGASSGIGEALAYALSTQGASLILSSRRLDELERVRQHCPHPEQVRLLPMDLAETTGRKEKTEAAIALFGRVDIMVHNGGISQRSMVKDTDMAVHRRLMEIDYFSYVELTTCLLPHFVQRKAGHFVVVSSVMGKIGTPMRSAYAAAKHALHGFFDCLRAETASSGIQVTLVTPGYIRTQITINALTGTGAPLQKQGKDIEEGFPADKAAEQILKAVSKGSYEVYVGKMGKERVALLLNKWAPSLFKKLAPRQVPQ
jgi:short-subunit dehydrogenase